MQSAFLKSICQIGIFMVCAQTITHFRPNGSYEKYMKLLVSVMVLMQILQPVSSLFHLGGEKGQKEKFLQFQEQFYAGMADSMEEISRSEQILENMTLREVQKALEQEKQEALGAAEESEGGSTEEQAKEAGNQEPSEKVREIERVEKIIIGLDEEYGR
ncbi:MAG: stage III sporulation protein AF [Bacteroidales bacterium]|nr:stage III sporulation protein AF [Lachnoclostridium sp.]MCM1385334.1 stage III sporulation protein AF [Lachnoclostridium sp.]MCM1465969.1 stage III sporulation protein AF [Bacteroidales bacterium]